MPVTFPDPNFIEDYTYVSPNGLTINYTWDGEKWVTVGASDSVKEDIEDLETNGRYLTRRCCSS